MANSNIASTLFLSPDDRLREDVDAAKALLDRLWSLGSAGWDESRLLGIVTAAPTSELYIPYTIPLVLRQAEMAGFGADVILGLNNGYTCPDVIDRYGALSGVQVVHLETGEKDSLPSPGRFFTRGASSDYAFQAPSTRHRIFVVHQRRGPWSAGKTLMLLDLFSGLLVPNLERGWHAPRWTLLFDAESLFIEQIPDPHFPITISRARQLLEDWRGDAQAASHALFAEMQPNDGGFFRQGFDIASHGLVRLLEEFSSQPIDILGAATRFCAFRHRTRFHDLPVDMPTPADRISGMHLFYNHACGLLPGCFCMPGGGTLGKTEVLTSLMSTVLRRYPRVYGEDAIFTVLAEQAGLRLRISRGVQIINRCPTVEEEVEDLPRQAWKHQFAKWYRAFDQIEQLYGRDICRSVLGPDPEDVLAAGFAIAANLLRQTGDSESAGAILDQFIQSRLAFEDIRRLVHSMDTD